MYFICIAYVMHICINVHFLFLGLHELFHCMWRSCVYFYIKLFPVKLCSHTLKAGSKDDSENSRLRIPNSFLLQRHNVFWVTDMWLTASVSLCVSLCLSSPPSLSLSPDTLKACHIGSHIAWYQPSLLTIHQLIITTVSFSVLFSTLNYTHCELNH